MQIRFTNTHRAFLHALCLLLALSLTPTRLLAQTTTNYAFTGAATTFTVPAGITSLTVVANGAQGGSSFSGQGGKGGTVTATLAVTPGQMFAIYVGGQNGYNGGGSSSGGNPGGGGATDIRIGGTGSVNDRIVVAGGGGGGVNGFGGSGGGLIGGNFIGTGGPPGTPGVGGGNAAGGDGQGGISIGGGGGGGGYNGGTGGGFDAGGGGGSSYTNPTLATNVVHTQGANTGNGSLSITYKVSTLPVSLAYFNGRNTQAGAVLGWATAREDNNAGFQVERGT